MRNVEKFNSTSYLSSRCAQSVSIVPTQNSLRIFKLIITETKKTCFKSHNVHGKYRNETRREPKEKKRKAGSKGGEGSRFSQFFMLIPNK